VEDARLLQHSPVDLTAFEVLANRDRGTIV
jgi:hypothetical protein